jgi:hypothetical protein
MEKLSVGTGSCVQTAFFFYEDKVQEKQATHWARGKGQAFECSNKNKK